MIYLQMFLSFLQVGMFSIGGGLCSYAVDSESSGDKS